MRTPITIAAAVVAALIAASPASAHTPAVADSCTGLTVTLTNYEAQPGPATNNTVSVTIDGTTETFGFDTSFSQSFTWAPTSAHTWAVVIDANIHRGHPTRYDRTLTGEQEQCQQPTTTTSTTTPATTSTTSTTSTTTSPPTTPPATDAPTTTATPTTSTSSPPQTSSPTSSSVPDSTTTTTAEPGTTTTTAAEPSPTTTGPTPSSTTTGSSPDPTLPATGSTSDTTAAIAAGLLIIFGLMFVIASHRP